MAQEDKDLRNLCYRTKQFRQSNADAFRLPLAAGQDATVAHLSSVKNSAEMLAGYVDVTFLWC